MRDVTEVLSNIDNVDQFDTRDVISRPDNTFYYVTNNGYLLHVDKDGYLLNCYGTGISSLRVAKALGDYLFLAGFNNPFNVVKIDLNSMSIVWSYQYDIGETRFCYSGITDSSRLYLNFSGGGYTGVLKIDATTGSVVACKKFKVVGTDLWSEYDRNALTINTAGGYVYVVGYPHYSSYNAYIGTIIKVDKTDLTVEWVKRYASDYVAFTSVIYETDHLLITANPKKSGRYYHSLLKISPADGAVILSKVYKDGNLAPTDIAVVSDGYITLTPTGGVVVKWDKSFDIIKSYRNGNRLFKTTTSKNDRVFLSGEDGYLAILDKDLTLLGQDSEWEDWTNNFSEYPFTYSPTDVSVESYDVSVTRSDGSGCLASETPTFTVIAERFWLPPESCCHIQQVDQCGISRKIFVKDSLHYHVSEQPVVLGVVNVGVDGGYHLQQADQCVVQREISVQDSLHSHTSEHPVICKFTDADEVLVFIVPETGEQVEQEFKLLTVKRGQKVQLRLKFYKDLYRTQVWDLTGAVKSFFAKRLLTQQDYDIYKSNDSPDWDTSSAALGFLRLNLSETDLKERKSLYVEIEFQISDRIYKTPTWILEIEEDVK